MTNFKLNAGFGDSFIITKTKNMVDNTTTFASLAEAEAAGQKHAKNMQPFGCSCCGGIDPNCPDCGGTGWV